MITDVPVYTQLTKYWWDPLKADYKNGDVYKKYKDDVLKIH